jgi:transcriptional regulator with XRE-family HTH domain
MSNVELARRLGKSRAYVTKVLRGTTNFTLESLVRIGRALSCEVELDLLPMTVHAPAASKLIRNGSSKSPAKGTRKRTNKQSPKPSLFR